MTDRDKLTALLDELFKEGLTMTPGYMADYLMKNGVTVQKHGRWGEYETFPMAQSLNGYPCSNCGHHFGEMDISYFKYCPHCGAKMDGGEEDE